jgi:hypothetical protein
VSDAWKYSNNWLLHPHPTPIMLINLLILTEILFSFFWLFLSDYRQALMSSNERSKYITGEENFFTSWKMKLLKKDSTPPSVVIHLLAIRIIGLIKISFFMFIFKLLTVMNSREVWDLLAITLSLQRHSNSHTPFFISTFISISLIIHESNEHTRQLTSS